MAIRQRGDSWQVSLTQDGKRIRKQFPSPHEAERWEAEARAMILRGERVNVSTSGRSGPSMTLDQLREATWTRVWSAKGDDSKARLPYRNAERIINIIGRDTPISQVTSPMISEARHALLEQGKAPATANRHVAALSRMLSLAEECGWVESKPKCKLESERGNARMRWLSMDEERRLIETTIDLGYPDYADFWLFLGDTGMRRGAALKLRWEHVSDSRVHVPPDITKTGKGRVIPLTSRLSRCMTRRRRVTSPSAPWAGLTASKSNEVWTQVRKKIGLQHDSEFVIHALRHTFCSRLAQSGAGLLEIMQLSGHSSLSQLQRYAHLCTANGEAAMARLDRTLTSADDSDSRHDTYRIQSESA